MLIYANLRSPGRDPGVQAAIIFFFFFFSMSLQIYIFLTLIFFFLCPFRGIKFFFWPVENCTTWNLRYLMLRDAGWALRHWRSGFVRFNFDLFFFLYCNVEVVNASWFFTVVQYGEIIPSNSVCETLESNLLPYWFPYWFQVISSMLMIVLITISVVCRFLWLVA